MLERNWLSIVGPGPKSRVRASPCPFAIVARRAPCVRVEQFKYGVSDHRDTTDADGSLTQEATTTGTPTRGWDYDANNRAVSAWKGASEAAASLRTRWDYDAGGSRFRRVDDGSGQAACTTLYLGAVERKTCGATVTWRRTLAGVAVMELAGSTAGVVNHTRSLLHDHLGSVVAAVDLHSGGLVERGDYGAFGSMRTALDGVAVGVAALATTTRGFTGQEQLGSLDVIHMNGRIYDPQLGRFLQADPLVAQPANPQNWNPYAYVFNNPLANTDPTGMFSVGQALRTIAAIVVSIYFPEFAAWAWGWSAFAGAVGAGFLSGAIGTGSLKGGIEGAFTAGVTYGVGLGTAKAAWYTKAAAQGAAGGCLSVLEGGKFGNGFVSAGLTTAVMPLAGHSQYAAVRSVEGALIGGTISDLTGGKFANGAISGAVQGAMEEPEEAARTQNENGETFSARTGEDASSNNIVECKGDGGVNPVYYGEAKLLAGTLDSSTKQENYEYAMRSFIADDPKNSVQFRNDSPMTLGSHFSSWAHGPVPEEGYSIAFYMHSHPAAGLSLYANAADVEQGNPGQYVLGKPYTVKFGPSSPDMAARSSPQFIVTNDYSKLIYIPAESDALQHPNCYYLLSR